MSGDRRSSERAKTPSTKVIANKEPPPSSQRRRIAKRKRQDSSVIALEAVEEVEDGGESAAEESEEVEEVEVELTEEQRIERLTYESDWRLFNHRNVEVYQVWRQLTGNTNAFVEARTWALKASVAMESSIRRVQFRVFSKAMNKNDIWTSDIELPVDFEVVRKKLLQFDQEGWRDLRADVSIWLEKDEPIVTPATPVESQPIATSSKTKKKKKRQTATVRQEADLEDRIGEQEAVGDYSNSIRTRWPCAITDCKNHMGGTGGYCWWQSSNSKDGHYPISSDVVRAWSVDIKEGRRTVDEPSTKVVELLAKARERLQQQSHSHKTNPRRIEATATTQSVPFNFNVFTGITHQEAVKNVNQLYTFGADPPSSAPTETPPLELIDLAFEYCKKESIWRGMEADLDAMKTALLDNGYEIGGIGGLSAEDWQIMSLKRGQRDKFKQSIKRFRSSRKE